MKAARVEQRVNALAGQHLALFMLTFNGARGTGTSCLRLTGLKISEFVGNWVGSHDLTLVRHMFSLEVPRTDQHVVDDY